MWVGIGIGINRNRYAQGIFNAYSARVVADGGVVEAGQCVNAVTGLLLNASLLLIPSGYKGGKLYAEIPTNGNGDLTWTRGSDAFRTNASGVIQRVPWNLASYSEQFENGAWTKVNATITTNTTTAPNGTLTADKLTATATTSTHILLQQPAGSVSGATSTLSIYAKSAELSNIQFVNNAGGLGVANFDLSAGTAVLVHGVSASIENVGNGWYRCIMTYTPTTSGIYNVQIRLADSSGNTTFLGNGTDGVFLWGAQLVEGTTAQTYLPTTDRLGFPRLDYTYGSCPSALLEPQRTNLVPNQLSYNASTGVAYNTSVTDSPIIGINSARITKNQAAGTLQYANQTCTSTALTGSTTYTISAYFKYDGYDFQTTMEFNNGFQWGGTTWRQQINIASTGVTLGTSQSCTSSVQNAGNGWYRVSITMTTGASISGGTPVSYLMQLPSTLSTGQGFLQAVPQFEQGAYSTTVIPTSGATATRVADSFSRSNIYTNGLISASGGTWFVELRGNIGYTRDTSGGGFGINTNVNSLTNDNGFTFRNTGVANSRLGIYKVISSTNTLLYTTTTDTTKIAIKWNGSTADIFVNGTKQVSATTFTSTLLEFFNSSTVDVPKFIQQMALFPTPLTDAQCQTLTT